MRVLCVLCPHYPCDAAATEMSYAPSDNNRSSLGQGHSSQLCSRKCKRCSTLDLLSAVLGPRMFAQRQFAVGSRAEPLATLSLSDQPSRPRRKSSKDHLGCSLLAPGLPSQRFPRWSDMCALSWMVGMGVQGRLDAATGLSRFEVLV